MMKHLIISEALERVSKMKNRMKEYRSLLDVTQTQIAKKIGTGRAYVCNVEKEANKSISMSAATNLVEALIDISSERSGGRQCLLISVTDVFYE